MEVLTTKCVDMGECSCLRQWKQSLEHFFSHLKENEILQSLTWWNDSRNLIIQFSRVWELWVVEFWKGRMARTPYTSMRMLRTRVLVPNHSFCESSQYSRSSCELLWTIRPDWGRKGTRKTEIIRGQRCMDKCEIKRSEAFGVFSQTSIWKQFARIYSIRFKRVCELVSFRHRVSAGTSNKTRPDEDVGFGQIIPLCREYTLSVNRTSTQTACTDAHSVSQHMLNRMITFHGSRLHIFVSQKYLSSTSHVSFLAAPDTDHKHKFSLTCLTYLCDVLFLTPKSFGRTTNICPVKIHGRVTDQTQIPSLTLSRVNPQSRNI